MNADDLAARREARAPLPGDGTPAIEFGMDDERIIFRDQPALDEYVRGALADTETQRWANARRYIDLMVDSISVDRSEMARDLLALLDGTRY